MTRAPAEPLFRSAARADVPEIVRLLADDPLGATREAAGGTVDPAYYAAFEAIAADPNNDLIVAEVDRAVAGCLQVTLIPNMTYTGGSRLQIEGVRVDGRFRGQGLGEALVRHAVDRARAAGCALVQLTSNKARTDAIRFYERLGFTASHAGMKLDLR